MPRNCDVTGLETDEKDDPPLVLRKMEPLEPTATNLEPEGDATPPNVREGESTWLVQDVPLVERNTVLLAAIATYVPLLLRAIS
jgi:hypothetical protein